MIIGWVNTSRTDAGLRPLRGDRDLAYIAGVRASRMASNNVMNHTIGGNLDNQLRYRDVQWYRYGETIGWSGSAWTVEAARSLYRMWMASPSAPGPADELALQLHRPRSGLSLIQPADVRIGGHDRVARPHRRRWPASPRCERSGDDVALVLDRVRPRASRPTPPACATSTSSTAIGSGSWRTIRDNTTSTSLTSARPRPRPVLRHPRASDRPAWQCGRVDAPSLASGCPDRIGPAAPIRRSQPHQRPDPRVHRTHQAARRRPNRPRPGCPPRTSPRRTSSTRPGCSGCAGSASCRALAGSSRRPSTRASPTASGSCTRPGCGRARSIRACAPPLPRLAMARRSRPRAWSPRPCAWPASSTTWATDRSPTSSTTTSSPHFEAPADPRRPGAKRLTHEDLSVRIVIEELGPLLRGLRRAPGTVPRARRLRGRRVDRSASGSRSSSPSRRWPTRRCRAGCAGWPRCCRACSRSTTSTTSGGTPT